MEDPKRPSIRNRKNPKESSLEERLGSFGSHNLGLESKNSFVVPRITSLAATELVMESFGFP
jgi:hypothetical protein